MDPLRDYRNQVTKYLEIQGYTTEDSERIVKNLMVDYIQNPKVNYNKKNDKGDMESTETTLTRYLQELSTTEDIIVPSLTTYKNPKEQKSIHAEFMLHNTQQRSKHKKEAFKAKQLNQKQEYIYHDTMQKAMKIFNNSLSGAYASKSTILRNPSAHYTLTSMTRCVSSIGNSVTESLIAGNKYFKTSKHIMNYMLTILTTIPVIQKIIDKYNLYLPTKEDVLEMITYSYNNYKVKLESYIIDFLDKLTKEQLARILYTNDLWHIRKHNDMFIRTMLEKLSKKTTEPKPWILDKLQDDILTLVKLICHEETKGKHIVPSELKDTDLGNLLNSTAYNYIESYSEYESFINTFVKTNVFPIGIGEIRDLRRKCIVLSDTDSTCGSYDKWVEWYYKRLDYSNNTLPLVSVLMTINSQTVEHYLAKFSSNMKIPKENQQVLKMKNEFYWSVFIATNKNKHYFAKAKVQEGNIFNTPEYEVKGVHLISSATDQYIASKVKLFMQNILNTLDDNNNIKLMDSIEYVISLENEILRRIQTNDYTIFRLDTIKEPAAYKLEDDRSPVLHHNLWLSVFADKYGTPPKLPYYTIKLPTILTTRKLLVIYLEDTQDPILLKLKDFLSNYRKEALGVIRLPLQVIAEKGIPKELLSIIDYRRVVFDNLTSAYLILEALGIYKKPGILLKEQFRNLDNDKDTVL